MPTQEVARAARHVGAAAARRRRRHPCCSTAAGPSRGATATVSYSRQPVATLDVSIRPAGARGERRWHTTLALGRPVCAVAGVRRRAAGRARRRTRRRHSLSVLSYDLKHWIERLPRRLPWPRQPVLYCARYDWSYRANYRTEPRHIAAARADRLADRAALVRGSADAPPAPPSRPPPLRRPQPTVTSDAYTAHDRARARVHRRRRHLRGEPRAAVHRRRARSTPVRRCSPPGPQRYPMPFAAYVDGGDWALVSNSPECLLDVDGDRVATFPIKGTRRRDPGTAAAALAAALRSRRQGARRARDGRRPRAQRPRPRVRDRQRRGGGLFAAVRHYPLLVHMVSEVRGRLRPGTSLADLLRAAVPRRLDHRRAEDPRHADHRGARAGGARLLYRRDRLDRARRRAAASTSPSAPPCSMPAA